NRRLARAEGNGSEVNHGVPRPCDGGVSILYLKGALSARKRGGNLWQPQLLLQKRKVCRRHRKIFCRSRARIISNFMSATRSRRRISTRARSVSKVWPTAGRKLASKIAPATPFVRTS